MASRLSGTASNIPEIWISIISWPLVDLHAYLLDIMELISYEPVDIVYLLFCLMPEGSTEGWKQSQLRMNQVVNFQNPSTQLLQVPRLGIR